MKYSDGVRQVSFGDRKVLDNVKMVLNVSNGYRIGSDGVRWCQEGVKRMSDTFRKVSNDIRLSDCVDKASGRCQMVS